ncbi:aminoglycoside phosphotransferase family protein [Nocardiopsis sp. CNR-923]|uniref:aminoglycoside phosphotransferase family protein n=1 Tax=Nocardiopsis sp. CNR-923 TaxID=1904965 RepID=UPI0021CC6A9E|nr:aminoglycoside phosphotransferase family protein [Nocardiopsis sp. CNR-923]
MQYKEKDFQKALDGLGLSPDGAIRIGYLTATTTGPARKPGGKRVWVRVGTAADEVVWMRAEAIEEASGELAERIPMPKVLDTFTWEKFDTDENVTRQVRAHVFEYVNGSPVSPEPTIRQAPKVSDAWWCELRRAHNEISAARWAGPGQSEKRVRRWVAAMTGDDRFTNTAIEWRPQHNDFHWQNLLSPRLTIVDWEGYSLAPVGSDAATLLTYSLTHTPTAERVRELFSDVLSGETGKLAQVFAAANVWTAIKNGFHPHLEQPLKEHVRKLLSV